MGLLGSLLGAASGKGGGALLTNILGHLAGGSGMGKNIPGAAGGIDLGSLIGKLQKGGLGDAVGSWIGMGNNLPVSPDQLGNAFGKDQLKDIATKLGIPSDQLTQILAQHLPKVVDKLTPKGQIPTGDVSGDLDELVKNTKFDDLDKLIAEYEAKK
ncbi:MAG TPA: YidB family protein [Gemmatales bacterium]|nr:YidB family protein [Gemmatales bacterium]